MRFTAIDLAGLTAPGVVETLDYEAILSELKADCVQRMADAGVDYDVQSLESDPVVKILEVAAYRELLLRARVNNAARAVMLAFSQKEDLEHLGVYYGVERQVVQEATPTTPEVLEADERFRQRIQIAPEALSTAGPEGAYVFHAMTVDPTIRSVRVYQAAPGNVHVMPLVSTGNGIPSDVILDRIRQRLNEEDIRPLTDNVTVRAASVLGFTISANLEVPDGPDPIVVRNAALVSIRRYLDSRFSVGTPVYRSGLIAAAKVDGVENVHLISPSADVLPLIDQVAIPSNISVSTA